MHRLVAQYFCQVIDACAALPILKERPTDVERACLSILAILKVTSIVFVMGDSDSTNLPFLDGVPQQVGQIWRFGDGLPDGSFSLFGKAGVFPHLQEQGLNSWINRRHASPPSICAPYTHSRFAPPSLVS